MTLCSKQSNVSEVSGRADSLGGISGDVGLSASSDGRDLRDPEHVLQDILERRQRHLACDPSLTGPAVKILDHLVSALSEISGRQEMCVATVSEPPTRLPSHTSSFVQCSGQGDTRTHSSADVPQSGSGSGATASSFSSRPQLTASEGPPPKLVREVSPQVLERCRQQSRRGSPSRPLAAHRSLSRTPANVTGPPPTSRPGYHSSVCESSRVSTGVCGGRQNTSPKRIGGVERVAGSAQVRGDPQPSWIHHCAQTPHPTAGQDDGETAWSWPVAQHSQLVSAVSSPAVGGVPQRSRLSPGSPRPAQVDASVDLRGRSPSSSQRHFSAPRRSNSPAQGTSRRMQQAAVSDRIRRFAENRLQADELQSFVADMFFQSLPRENVADLKILSIQEGSSRRAFLEVVAAGGEHQWSRVKIAWHLSPLEAVSAILANGICCDEGSACRGRYGRGGYVALTAAKANAYYDKMGLPGGLRNMFLVLALPETDVVKGQRGERPVRTATDCTAVPTEYCFVDPTRLTCACLLTYRWVPTGRREKVATACARVSHVVMPSQQWCKRSFSRSSSKEPSTAL
eukprot:TRINITY_DN48782_c0_g1_i1.p1 TRINITY_DN48782_c0_g1~~TRINITY_DN48782_c0_g1_i1.p1  ORF type:complete len:569 (+),score=78.88 TRINITY_DN48782_c0_g1_i1:132-1838(+)